MTRDNNILIKNIYYMLAYTYDTLTPSVFEAMQVERFDNIYNMYAHVLTRGLGVQLKKGLNKAYQTRTEEMTTVRGRISIPDTIRARMQQKYTLVCETDELTENHLSNQILKTTALFLLRHPDVDRNYKKELKRELMYFSDIDAILPQMIRWDCIRFQRHSKDYRIMLAVCRLLLEGMLLTTEPGANRLFTFQEIRGLSELEKKERTKKLAKLFETFVRKYYAREYRQFPGFSSTDETMIWQEDNGYVEYLPKMHTDITLTYGRKILIIDTKYYQNTLERNKETGNTFLSPDNLYQIFAYVKNKEAFLTKREKETNPNAQKTPPFEVSGMLLYARTQEPKQPDNVYSFMGSKISVKSLNLNADFQNIRRQLNDIVCTHFGSMK